MNSISDLSTPGPESLYSFISKVVELTAEVTAYN